MKCSENQIIRRNSVRHSNIELLRILAMFMIVIFHIIVHCVNVQLTNPTSMGRGVVDYFNHPVFYKKLLILNSMMTFGIIGNAVFMLISGYFMANRKPQDIKIGNISKKLLFQLGFASILLVCGAPILHFLKPNIYVYMPSITFFNDSMWFVGYYFMVILCGAIFLNNFLLKLDFEKYSAFLLALFAFVQFSYSGGFAEAIAGGLRTILTGIFLYSLGGFIRRFDPFKNVRLYVFFLLTFLVYVLIWISGYNTTQTNIETYIRSGTTEPFIQSVPIFQNFSIIIMILSICMFEVFRRIQLPESRIISFIGKSTFMIYLVHDNSLFYELWNLRDWVTTMWISPVNFILNVLKWGVYTFAAGVMAYVLFVGVQWLLKKSKRLFVKESAV